MIWFEFTLGTSAICFAFVVLIVVDLILVSLGRWRVRRDGGPRRETYRTDAHVLEAYERDRQAEAEGRDGH